jgi:protein-S-isoprenylcysteine O-methyltransferase Ste14
MDLGFEWTVPRSVLLALVVLAGGSFNWGSWAFFRRSQKPLFWLWVLFVLGPLYLVAGALAALAAPGVDGVCVWLGCSLIAASIALFWWAVRTVRRQRLRVAFARELPDSVFTTGPYAWMRHPFYASYSLTLVGTCVALQLGWFVPPTLLMVALYVFAAWREERLFPTTALASDYAAYRARVGLFWPRMQRPR